MTKTILEAATRHTCASLKAGWSSPRRGCGRRDRRTGDQVLISAASVWEITIKRSIAKLVVDGSIDESAVQSGFDRLPVLAKHAEGVGGLPALHSDPFDHLLIAQAWVEQLVLVTRDERIERYDVSLLRC